MPDSTGRPFVGVTRTALRTGTRRTETTIIAHAIAATLVDLLAIYAACGLVFTVPFALRGAGALDPAARRGTRGFRLLIVPGTVALWPMLLMKWRRAARGNVAAQGDSR